jgi:hypothetical protein
MRLPLSFLPWTVAMGLMIFTVSAARPPEEHRATHLGNPATRFAPPLSSPAELRALFADPRIRPDIVSILRQWQWRGDTNDLFRAAADERIREIRIPVGTRLPFMSSRENGRPILLRNVLWAGREPIDAYEFVFNSEGRRYRCLTPRACSNFLLVDLGPVRPELEVELTVPPEFSLCRPFETEILVRNAGHIELSEVVVTAILPDGLTAIEPRSLAREIGLLRVGEVRKWPLQLAGRVSGDFPVGARGVSAEGGRDEARASTRGRGPALAIECMSPPRTPVSRPTRICFDLRNMGDAPDSNLMMSLPLPGGAIVGEIAGPGMASTNGVVWIVGQLDPGASVQCCVELSQALPGVVSLAPMVSGNCGMTAQAQCEIEVVGVPGILMEVVDLEDPIEIGRNAIYEVRVTNQGLAVIQNVRLSGLLSEFQEFVSGSGPTIVSGERRDVMFAPVAELNPKQTVSWQVHARAMQPGIAQFQVTLNSDSLRREVVEIETTNQY